MKRILRYKILHSTQGQEGLSRMVMAEISKGWQPLGGVAVSVYPKIEDLPEEYGFDQAMVQYAD